jgi:hypothetical protein
VSREQSSVIIKPNVKVEIYGVGRYIDVIIRQVTRAFSEDFYDHNDGRIAPVPIASKQQ